MKTISLPNVEISLYDSGPKTGQIDEIFVKTDDGICVFHMERMSERHFWAAGYSKDGRFEVAMDFSATTSQIVDEDGDSSEVLEIYAATRTDEPEEDDCDPETGCPKEDK